MAQLLLSGTELTTGSNLEWALQLVENRLAAWASNSDAYNALLLEVFGAQSSDATSALQASLSGSGLGIGLEILAGDALSGISGAYTSAAPDGSERIYFNGAWLQNATAPEIEAVLLEELGHAIDHQLNGAKDSPGDEGEIFSALLRGEQPAASAATENDQRLISINDIAVAIEAADTTAPTGSLGSYATAAAYAAATTNPFGIGDVGFNAKPAFADADADGDLDLFIGERYGCSLFFRNTAAAGATAPAYAAAATNPFGISDVGSFASPAFADADRDGDLDLFIGNRDGNTLFFRNTANSGATAPAYAAAATNPFGIGDIGSFGSPAFADADADGDLDLFVGNRDGNTLLFRNTAAAGATAPAYAAAATNPFSITDVGSFANPVFVDVDRDGDLDLFIGNNSGCTPLTSNATATITLTTRDVVDSSLHVTSLADDGSQGTLRWAINQANAIAGGAYDAISIDVNGVISLTSDLPYISQGITIAGLGESSTIIDGNNLYRAFYNNGSRTIRISDVTIKHGKPISGGMIWNQYGTMYINRVKFTEMSSGSAVYQKEGGSITFNDSKFSYLNYGTESDYGSTPAAVTNVDTAYANRMYFNNIIFDHNYAGIYNYRFTKIQNSTFTFNTNYGAYITGLNRSQIYNSIFDNNGTAIYHASRTPTSWTSVGGNNRIMDGNIFTNNNQSIYLNDSWNDDHKSQIWSTITNNFWDKNGTFVTACSWNGTTNVASNAIPSDTNTQWYQSSNVVPTTTTTAFFRNTANPGATAPAYAAASTNPFGISNVGSFASPAFADADTDGDLDLFIGEYFGCSLFFRNTAATPVAPVSSSTANGSYGVSLAITLKVQFSEAVVVNTTGGTPRLQLETGSVDRYAMYSGGSGTNTLSFTYTVQAGDSSADLDQLSSSALTLNGGTIKDAAGNNAILTLATPGATGSLGANAALVIDTTAPATPSLALASDSGISNSDGITSIGTINVSGLETAVSWQYSTNGGSSWLAGTGTSFSMAPGTYSAGSIRVRQSDIAGNTSANGQLSAVTIDTSAPTAPSLALAVDTGSSNSDGITNKGIINISGLETGVSWQYSINGGSSWLAGTGTSFSIAPGTYGAGSILVRQSDLAGNTSANGQLGAITIDTTAPAPTGSLSYASAPAYAAAATNPFGISAVGYLASPAFADADGDGDLDLFIGERYGCSLFFRNTAAAGATTPAYAAAATNPFSISDVGSCANPAFADADADGDLDLFIGEFYGNTLFFRNTANPGATAPAYAAAATNPFGISNVGSFASPAFADADGDGDLDLFIGDSKGNTIFFSNTAAAGATAPAYAAAASNPFGISKVDYFASPAFADADGDGDLDLFIGDSKGNTIFFSNTAAAGATAPAYAAAATNPFGISKVDKLASPAFADADGDGDLDLYIGEFYGNTIFLSNTAASTFVAPVSPSTANGSYGIGAVISLKVKFSEAVLVTTTGGIPRLQLETGSVDRYAIYSGGSGTNTLGFSYTVQAGDKSTDLDQLSSSALELNGGTIQDAAGNNAILTLAAPGTTGSLAANGALVIDTTAPATPSLALASDTGISNSDAITNIGTINVSGLEDGTRWQYSTDAGGSWRAGTGSSFELTPGTYGAGRILVRQRDIAGNTSDTAQLEKITVDTSAPDGPSIALASDTGASNADGITNNGTINVSDLETGASWQYSTNAGGSWRAGTGSSFELTPGTYGAGSILVRQRDIAGNTSDTDQLEKITVDTSAPDGPSIALASDTGANEADGITNNGTINVTGLEDGSSWQYSTNAGGSWRAGTGSFFELTPGTYGAGSILVRQRDIAGNASDTAQLEKITVDSSAPDGPSIALASDTGISNSDSITSIGTINVNGLEDGTSWQYSTDAGGSWLPGTGSSFELDSGSYDAGSILVRQSDLAGNSSDTAQLEEITIDTSAPDGPSIALAADTGASDADGITNNGTINISGMEDGSSWQYSTNAGSGWLAGTGSSFELTPGTYSAGSILVRQRDIAGNASDTAQLEEITVDTSAPDGPSIALASDTGISNSDAITNIGTINVSSLETGASWQYSTNAGGSWRAGTGSSFELTPGTYGAGSILVRQRDIAGNTSIAATISTGASLLPGLETTSIKYLASTGHYYEYVTGPIDWTQARDAAANRTFNGATGYLATITSATENAFLANLKPDDSVWIGASDAGTEGVWKWVTGPEAGTVFWNGSSNGTAPDRQYTNWEHNSEPNNLNNEDYAYMLAGSGYWNDLAGWMTIGWTNGYFVEYAGLTTDSRELSVTIDATAPSVPILALASDSGINDADGITNNDTINVSGLEDGSSWQYSINAGSNWHPGTGSSFELTPGTYGAGSILVRQSDLAGNASANGQS